MIFPWQRSAIAALILVALSCGDKTNPDPAPDTALPPQTAAGGGAVEVAGKLSTSLAPPSSLVALDPRGDVEVPVKTEPAVMNQVSLEFLPAFLLVQAGQTVEFRNGEDVLHNIRVTEVAGQQPVFNVATPPGGKYVYKFERPGFYNVGCDIHQTMRADILVMKTPYTAVTGTDGSFTMTNVKPGEYNLTVYAGAVPVVRPIEVKNGRTDLGVIQ